MLSLVASSNSWFAAQMAVPLHRIGMWRPYHARCDRTQIFASRLLEFPTGPFISQFVLSLYTLFRTLCSAQYAQHVLFRTLYVAQLGQEQYDDENKWLSCASGNDLFCN